MQQIHSWLAGGQDSKAVVITVNAGAIPADHWTQDPNIGGGRIIGEACHFIDLARFLVGHTILDCHASPMTGAGGKLGDCATLNLEFTDGSIATIHYFSNGSKQFSERTD